MGIPIKLKNSCILPSFTDKIREQFKYCIWYKKIHSFCEMATTVHIELKTDILYKKEGFKGSLIPL